MTSTHVVLLVIFLLCPDRCSPWPCTEERLVYSNISFRSNVMVSGADLSYKYDDPILIQHPCEAYYHGGHTPPAIYLGNKVFFSKDGFQSSLLPLTIPNKMVTAPAEVTSAVFVQDNRMLLVVNEQVYVYFYGTWKTWIMSEGLDTPVTDITNIDCCYSRKDRTCWEVSRTIIAYKPGDPADVTDVYFSKNGGYSFGRITIAPSSNKLVSIYNFVSLSQLAVLLNMTRSYGKSAYFTYGGAAYMENREGSKFCLEPCTNETVGSLIPPGLRGFIVLWTKDTFLFSFNNGLTIDSITVQPTEKYSNKSLPLHGNGLCNVAANKNEIAALTKNLKLFYGMLDMEFTKMVHIGERDSGNTCEVMMFEKVGVLVIIKPVPSKDSAYYHFQKCIINIQDTLMSLRPPLEPCPVEILSGNFHNKMYYIDMKQELHFNVTFVPKPGTGTYPYVTVSNPHVLAFQADLKEDGYTFNGNAKYRLDIRLLQQIFSGMAHSQFQDDMYSGRLSTITVDIYNKGIFCIDMHPLTALIAVDCPPKKEIRIAKSTTACSRGLFKDVMLQSNYTYSINWDLYDPMFLGRKSLVQGKLNVTYNYNHWGCPLLLYYDSPWLPVLELWDNDEFVEYVSADFVLFEINGMHNYDYLLDEVEANCMSQAQNWTTLIEKDPEGNPHFAWSRYLYESCKEPRGNDSLPSASSKYQVLNRNENNRVLFPQYNGIYVFKAIVVDTVYSYCELSTVFSVYVHGALPKSEINVGKTLVSFLVLIFGSVLMVYYFPKLMKENARMKTVWT
ncbi:cation channel sperm-associated auxiliary subunit delta [Rhineura floridana]|uniref:cation channel sperm-associated auxiliary subunit delta n=1 Tax=Rhineura floridana TaxID=261503 RepID=UPI002AC8257E|nr:cation channel sperm-associated auxiliary subunit delta [Rhineura floridana]